MKGEVIVAGALVAAAICFIFRWEAADGANRTTLLDRWSGRVILCNLDPQQRPAGVTSILLDCR